MEALNNKANISQFIEELENNKEIEVKDSKFDFLVSVWKLIMQKLIKESDFSLIFHLLSNGEKIFKTIGEKKIFLRKEAFTIEELLNDEIWERMLHRKK
jgi:hypothetical protein